MLKFQRQGFVRAIVLIQHHKISVCPDSVGIHKVEHNFGKMVLDIWLTDLPEGTHLETWGSVSRGKAGFYSNPPLDGLPFRGNESRKGEVKDSLRHLLLLSSYFVLRPPWHIIFLLYLLWTSDLAQSTLFVSSVVIAISCSVFVILSLFFFFPFLNNFLMNLHQSEALERKKKSVIIDWKENRPPAVACSFCLCYVETYQGVIIALNWNDWLRICFGRMLLIYMN